MCVEPAVHQLSRFVRHGVAAPVDVEREVLRRLFDLVDVHDTHQHEHALPLSQGDSVVHA